LQSERLRRQPNSGAPGQPSELGEIVAYGSMAGGNLKAINRVVRIVSEMDR
jgi:hypothetical protein